MHIWDIQGHQIGFSPGTTNLSSAARFCGRWSPPPSVTRFDLQLYLRSVLAHLPGLPPDELQNYLPDVWKRALMAKQQMNLNTRHAVLVRAINR